MQLHCVTYSDEQLMQRRAAHCKFTCTCHDSSSDMKQRSVETSAQPPAGDDHCSMAAEPLSAPSSMSGTSLYMNWSW